MKIRLLGLNKNCFSSWCETIPVGTTMVVQPKVEGYAIGLRYKYGQLVDAYSRDYPDMIENIRKLNSIPLSIDDTLKVEVELEGILYYPIYKSELSTDQYPSYSKKPIKTTKPLKFLALQIYSSTNNYLSDLTQLQKWGFDVPITLRTGNPNQVKIWHSQWINNELFSNLPTNGIVARCNSSGVKEISGISPSCPHWALALTR